MKSGFPLTLAACLMLTSTAARGEAIWDGTLVVKSTGANCGTSWTANDYASVVFRPAGLDGNGADTFLSIVQGDRAYSVKVVAGALSGDGTYAATYTKDNGQTATYSATFKSMTATPAAFTAGTKVLVLKGVLGKMDGVVGCSVNFQAAFVKRP